MIIGIVWGQRDLDQEPSARQAVTGSPTIMNPGFIGWCWIGWVWRGKDGIGWDRMGWDAIGWDVIGWNGGQDPSHQ